MFIQGFDLDGANEFSLSIQGPHPASASGIVYITSPDLFLGWAVATRSIHRCLADRLTWCYACDMFHDPENEDACPHILGQTAAPANRVSFPSGTNGTEIVVHGDNAGDVTLTAHIKGYAGPPPICEAKVVPETVVPVHAFIICSASGTPATTTNRVVSLLSGANDIYAQVGRRFELASLSFVTNHAWMTVTKAPSGDWPEFYNIVSYTNGTGGIEVYFNDGIDDANGLTVPSGVLIANSGNTNTVAHEFGHAQGLPDIYNSRNHGAIVVTGTVSRARLQSDWDSSADEGYYERNLDQSVLIERLLMFGIGSDTKRDLPSGDIHGIWRPVFTVDPWQVTNALSGFFLHATPHPTSN